MPVSLLLCLSLLAALIASIARKSYTNRNRAGALGVFSFNFATHLVITVIFLLWGGFRLPSLFTLWLGLAFGLITSLQGVAFLAALGCGPMSYTTVIVSFSTLISALSGALFFDERLSFLQGVGILLMLCSFILAAKKETSGAKTSKKWLILCFVAFLLTGAIGVLQKIHQSSPFKEEANEFLILAFLFSSCFSLVLSLWTYAKKKSPRQERHARGAWRHLLFIVSLCAADAAGAAVNNKLNLSLSGVIDSAVFFPIVNGGSLLLSMLAALLLFKERPTRRQWLGIAAGVLAVLLLCIP